MTADRSKWCVAFLRKVRREFRSLQRTAWYDHLVCSVDPAFGEMGRRRRARADVDIAEEARKGLAALLSNFTHLDLPDGTELGVDGEFRGLGGSVCLTVCIPGKDPIPVAEVAHDPMCVESIWEKEVLAWVSSQFCLFWHDGYSQCTILLGDASSMEREIRSMDHGIGFLSAVGEMPDEMRREYLATDFSPRVEMADGMPQIVFHVFSPFGGIFRRIACAEVPEEEDAIFPYDCGVCY